MWYQFWHETWGISLLEKKILFHTRFTCTQFNFDKATKKKNRIKKTFLFICCSRKTFSGLIKLVPCLHFKNIFQFQLLDSHSTKGNILRYVYYYNQWEISFDGKFVPLSSLWHSHYIPIIFFLLPLHYNVDKFTVKFGAIPCMKWLRNSIPWQYARRGNGNGNDNFWTSSFA